MSVTTNVTQRLASISEVHDHGFRPLSTRKNVQAVGDLQTVRDHGLPAERVRLQGDPVKAHDGLRERRERLGD